MEPADLSTHCNRSQGVGRHVRVEHEVKQMDFTKWLDRTDLRRSSSWRGLLRRQLSVLEKIGWEAWTRTRIARFRIWSPANWTTSQQCKISMLRGFLGGLNLVYPKLYPQFRPIQASAGELRFLGFSDIHHFSLPPFVELHAAPASQRHYNHDKCRATCGPTRT